MNNTISVYELLGLIKDGKAPKKIKYKGDTYIYAGDDYSINDNREDWLITKYDYFLTIFLTEEVEILEEDKLIIEKIDTTIENTLFTMECYTGIPEQAQDWNFKVLKNKLNEVIDYINRREDK